MSCTPLIFNLHIQISLQKEEICMTPIKILNNGGEKLPPWGTPVNTKIGANIK